GRAQQQHHQGQLPDLEHPQRPDADRFVPDAGGGAPVKSSGGAQNMNTRMHRRMFLRGLGGAVVAAPFLSSVWEKKARGQTAAAAASPKQLIVMFTHYGCVTTKWFPAKSHGAL